MEIVGIGDFLLASGDSAFRSAGAGGVMTEALPSGPDGQTHACVSYGVYLVHDGGARLAIVLQPVSRGPRQEGHPADRRPGSGSPACRPARDQAPDQRAQRLPRPGDQLRASGQHLKRGILLHGAPGTGKTHTVRYLLGQLPEVTVIVISGRALSRIKEACSVARSLQPAIVVVEDVDLIAEQREARPGEHPLLFQLLNEMDGLNSAADVTFLLTTNRADLLEPALASRPGRVDLAAELPLPDAAARRRLIGLYRGDLVLDLADEETASSGPTG
jgi:hypothetical protein